MAGSLLLVPAVPYDRYLRFDEITEILRAFQSEYADLVTLESIGKSHEGRDIWCVTVTDTSTGPANDKPAFWCDGNIHASEVSASSTVLKIIDLLCTTRPEVLKERAFYLVPRLGPDGAEWALETPPRIVRSGTRHYPYEEEEIEGLERQDLDGDGRILAMRIPDSNGPWVVSEEEPRLLRKRKPGERNDKAYRLLPEGLIQGWDGQTIKMRRQPQGLDFNRNFPNAWRQEFEQHGAGPYPASEPEIRAAVDFIASHPNICGGITFHTFSGVLLRPPSRMPDDDIPSEDLWTYQTLGKVGQEMTGYPPVSNYHEFRYHPKEVITGVFDDWMYHSMGVHAWTVEIWSPQRQAGITDYKYIDWFRDHPHSDDIAMLKWSDEKLEGKGHVEWQPFDHPQLGPVEIGGWDGAYCFRNPPPPLLDAEITPLAEWAIWHAGTGPLLAERSLEVEVHGDQAEIRLTVENRGWLPTQVTETAVKNKICRGVIGSISLVGDTTAATDRPAWLISGERRMQGPQLAGYCHTPSAGFGWNADTTDDRHTFRWRVAVGGTYKVVAAHDRAGTVRATVTV
ncbi:MAG: hypothetical protein KF812_08935 [Fimbriimonadaceae bacterium]|nr:hypothetical protein [Fimbriimonadaceae bacterium]